MSPTSGADLDARNRALAEDWLKQCAASGQGLLVLVTCFEDGTLGCMVPANLSVPDAIFTLQQVAACLMTGHFDRG